MLGEESVDTICLMVSFKAHYDGKVFVPDEPVNVPQGTSVRLAVITDESGATLTHLADIAASFTPDPNWPNDGAAQVDHYLYGLPKQP